MDTVAAVAAVIAALAAVGTGVVAARTLQQQRRDSIERSRPMVAAELRDDLYAPSTQILVVRNYGPTLARNVTVEFDPEIPDPDDPTHSVTPFLKRRYAQPIPVLTPGMELDNLWYVGGPGGGSDNTEPMPDQVTVRISYEGSDGRQYVDTFPLDVMIIRNRTYVDASTSPLRMAKEALRVLQAIEHKLPG